MSPAAEEPRLRIGTSGWSYDHWRGVSSGSMEAYP
jgi:uncharacterized protein YecE (DUF72 family)